MAAQLKNLGTPLSELPAPVREKIAKLIDAVAPVRWIDASPNPHGVGPWKRPLTYVRIAHGEDRLFSYWLRDDTGVVVGSRVIQ